MDRYHVSAGSSVVSKSKPLVLSASLGTCVSVALFDVTNRIGGLIHLLLPEPVSTEGALCPEKYASTGLPVFIQALLHEGAAIENMQAVIAGGALVGPLMERDLSLDIGGRTAEIAKTFLTQAGIPILRSETGGFFTCRLSLNLQTFKTEIEPIAIERCKCDQKPALPSPKNIIKALDRIYPIPQIALKILRLVDDDNYDLRVIADEVKKDQVISAQTLKLCNSALFSRGRPIETLDHAVLLLGQDLLVQLVISAAVKGFFDLKGHGYSLCKGGLFYHAIGTAQMAAILAATTGKATNAAAYTAGLLHDIGKVVLDQFISSVFPMFYRNLTETDKSIIEAEREILGIDHTEVGRLLAEKWSFPASLIHVIQHHHQPEKEETYSDLAHILYLADLLITKFHPGLEIERMDEKNLDKRLQKIGLSAERLPELVDMIPPSVFLNTSETALRVG